MFNNSIQTNMFKTFKVVNTKGIDGFPTDCYIRNNEYFFKVVHYKTHDAVRRVGLIGTYTDKICFLPLLYGKQHSFNFRFDNENGRILTEQGQLIGIYETIPNHIWTMKKTTARSSMEYVKFNLTYPTLPGSVFITNFVKKVKFHFDLSVHNEMESLESKFDGTVCYVMKPNNERLVVTMKEGHLFVNKDPGSLDDALHMDVIPKDAVTPEEIHSFILDVLHRTKRTAGISFTQITMLLNVGHSVDGTDVSFLYRSKDEMVSIRLFKLTNTPTCDMAIPKDYETDVDFGREMTESIAVIIGCTFYLFSCS